ncbi:insulinase family protein [Rhodobacteraceae bacterium RKSG542]|uniref:M16 family metallopeptidase n=1 Tax=Pseudovibrio flavus TaxID=2529854 RepID=UPI0012BD2744|nr:pitrilysin family protein [Pseudovibrio flavus]MTI18657.1 insulinase family protein [Pseudovibrio flavus]
MAVKTTVLENGLTVVTDHMEHLKTSALGVWVKAGSRSEGVSQNGVTHLLEHMAFKGTKTRSAPQIAEEIEAVGGEMNASTSIEHTNYYVRTLAEDVPLGLDILADILQESVFDPEELAREKNVIIQEIGAANDTPEDQAFDLLLATAWPDQAIGRPILGTPETVNSFSPDAIREYMADHYRASCMVVAAAGAVDHDELVKLASERFCSLPVGEGQAYPAATYHGGSCSIEKDLQEVQVILGFEGLPYHHEDYYAAQILASVLGGGMSSRLFQEVRETRGLCYSIYSFHWAFADNGLFAIHAATGPENTSELMPVVLEELKKISASVNDKEVQRAQAQIKASLLMALESPTARAGQIARQMMIHGRIISVEELTERVNAVTSEQIRRVAAKMFSSGAPTLVHVGPKSDILTHEQVKEVLSSISA